MRSPKNFAVIAIILLTILIPQASATISPITSQHDTIVTGDTVTFIGSGATNGTVAIWVMGRDYFAIKTVEPDKKGNFTLVIKPEDTRTYSSGQYAFLLLDPGSNNAIEIEPLVWDEGIKIALRGKIITDIGKKEDLPALIGPKVDTIITAAKIPGVDDIITPYFFYVETPSIHFDGLSGSGSQSWLPKQTTGEKIEITGTTNMGVENQLHVEIRNMSSRALITSGNIPVAEGPNLNRWSYTLAAPGLPAGDYSIRIGRQNWGTSETATALLTIEGHNLSPAQSPGGSPGFGQDFGVLVPIFISIGALGVIGIIIIASMKI
jgi:hypothetical protein